MIDQLIYAVICTVFVGIAIVILFVAMGIGMALVDKILRRII